jgi:hypothetical protein
MRLFLIAAIAALAFAGATNALATGTGRLTGLPDAHGRCHDARGHFMACPAHGPVCSKSKPCGNTCIARDKVCHVR